MVARPRYALLEHVLCLVDVALLVQIGDVQIRLKIVPLQGMKTSPLDGSSKKLFGKEEADLPLQMALASSPAPDPRFIERGPKSLKDRFPSKCKVVLTKGKYRGCIGTVLSTLDKDKVGVKVSGKKCSSFGLSLRNIF